MKRRRWPSRLDLLLCLMFVLALAFTVMPADVATVRMEP